MVDKIFVSARQKSRLYAASKKRFKIGVLERLDITSVSGYHTQSNPRGCVNKSIRNVSIGQGGLLHDVELYYIASRCIGVLSRLFAGAVPRVQLTHQLPARANFTEAASALPLHAFPKMEARRVGTAGSQR